MSGRFKVVIADFIQDDLQPERRILGDLADVEALDAFNEDDLVGRIENADAVMLYHHLGLSRRTIERLEHCKLIVRCGVGYDNIDSVFARQRGIPVANVPGLRHGRSGRFRDRNDDGIDAWNRLFELAIAE